MENQAQYSLVLTTFPDQEQANAFAEQLILRQLAACVNILPEMTSVYFWKGQVEQGREYQLLIKTKTSRFEELSRYIVESHPYELPEIIEVPINNGLPEYLSWINGVVES